jgi:general secretion pathway protein D
LAAGLAIALVSPMTPAWAVTNTGSGSAESSPAKAANNITLRLQDAPLTTAINFLTQQADVVIANNDGLKDKTVTVNLKDKPIEQALDQILTTNGVPWYRDDDGTYVINASRPAPKESSAASSGATGILPAPPAPAPAGRFVVTEKIELTHASPDEMMQMLGLNVSGGKWVKKNGFSNTNLFGDMLGSYGEPKSNLVIHDLSSGSLRPANPNNAINANGSSDAAPSAATDEMNPIVPDASSTGADGFNRTPGDRDQFGQGPAVRVPGYTPRANTPTVPGAPGTNPATGGPNAPGGNQAAARGFVPPGIDLVAGMQSDNSLLVQGTPDDIEELRNVIRLLDIAPQQVSIKVDVINVSNSALRQFGASWQFFTKEGNITAQASGAPSGGGLAIDVIRGNVQAVIGALTSNGRGRVISSPIVTTVNNIPAQISQSDILPIFEPVITTSVGGTISQSTLVPVQSTTGLLVTPRVNRDGTINVTGQVQISNIVQLVTSPDGTQIAPEINQTSLGPFMRRVASGETLVIGGLNTKNESVQETRIPLLSDIPLIGKLFRSRTRNDQENQMLIFITPSIVTEHANEARTGA